MDISIILLGVNIMNKDLLFKTNDFLFSYRVAGILIRDGKILLQKPKDDIGYAIPGGHVSYGEIAKEALIREFKEEINADIKKEELKFVGEIFFPWGNMPCQQIVLFYTVSLCNDNQVPLTGSFEAKNGIDFYWILLSDLHEKLVYPQSIINDLINLPDQIKYFIEKEE